MDAASGSSGGAPKSRRSHRKSRNGCHECKRRHIRCDEGRPACTNCKIAERECSFPRQDTPQQLLDRPTSGSTRASPAATLRSTIEDPGLMDRKPSRSPGIDVGWGTSSWPATPPQSMAYPSESLGMDTASSSSSGVGPSSLSGMSFTSQHLMLLHHAETAMTGDLTGHGRSMPIVDIAIRHAVDCPYLIDQLLALSAMHLAQGHPEQSPLYLHLATELQTRALASFGNEAGIMATTGLSVMASAMPSEGSMESVPRFLFTTTLTLHVLTETLSYHRGDFGQFLNRFAECVHLHRGVRGLLQPTWSMLQQSQQLQNTMSDRQGGSECDSLFALIDGSPSGILTAESAEACRGAARSLQWSFDMASRLPNPDVPHVVTGFTVTMPAEFAELLRRQPMSAPEALVVLAYYGVLLHRRRRYWVCGNSGAYVILSVARALGDQWRGTMRWPLQVLEEEDD